MSESKWSRFRRKQLDSGYFEIILNAQKAREVDGEFIYYTQCTYCGEDANEWDHVPSLAVMERIIRDEGIDEAIKYLKLKVPACRRCNAYLSDMPLNTLRERMTAIIIEFLL